MNLFLTNNVSGQLPTMEEIKRDLIEATLIKMHGNKTHAARSLGISLRALRNNLKRYELNQWIGVSHPTLASRR